MPATQRRTDKRTALRRTGMLQQLAPTLEHAVQHTLNVVATRNLLADIALEHRWHTAIPLRWRQSARTENRTIDPLDFTHHQSRQEQHPRILALCNLDGIAAHSAGMLIGHPGTGTTFLATCLASAACHANLTGLCTTALDMSNHLIAAAADHSRLKKLQHDATPDLLVCDEWGYRSLGQQGSHLFFQVISQRHQRQSTVLTTNVPCAEWGKGFDSTTVATAIADRRVHNSEVLMLGGSRYRRKRTSPHSRPTTAVKGAFHVSPLAPNARFLSLDERQPGPRASTCPPGLCFN